MTMKLSSSSVWESESEKIIRLYFVIVVVVIVRAISQSHGLSQINCITLVRKVIFIKALITRTRVGILIKRKKISSSCENRFYEKLQYLKPVLCYSTCILSLSLSFTVLWRRHRISCNVYFADILNSFKMMP